MSPKHLTEPYGEGVDERWDHVIGPEIARAHERYRATRPARHRASDPAVDYFEALRSITSEGDPFMRAIDRAQQRLSASSGDS